MAAERGQGQPGDNSDERPNEGVFRSCVPSLVAHSNKSAHKVGCKKRKQFDRLLFGGFILSFNPREDPPSRALQQYPRDRVG